MNLQEAKCVYLKKNRIKYNRKNLNAVYHKAYNTRRGLSASKIMHEANLPNYSDIEIRPYSDIEIRPTVDDTKNYYGFIYITVNQLNGKIYVGQKCFNSGWMKYLGSGVRLQNSIKSHGTENFKRYIIKLCDKESIDEVEVEWIIKTNSIDKRIGYNLITQFRGSHITRIPKKTIIKAYTMDGAIKDIAKKLGLSIYQVSGIRNRLYYIDITKDLKVGNGGGVKDDIVIKAYTMDGAVKDIAKKLGLTIFQVNSIRNGHLYSHITKDLTKGGRSVGVDRDTVIKVYTMDGSIKDIAKKLGLTICQVSAIRNRQSYSYITKDLKKGSRSVGIEDDIVIKAYTMDGAIKDTAKKLGITIAMVSSIRARKAYRHITKDLKKGLTSRQLRRQMRKQKELV